MVCLSRAHCSGPFRGIVFDYGTLNSGGIRPTTARPKPFKRWHMRSLQEIDSLTFYRHEAQSCANACAASVAILHRHSDHRGDDHECLRTDSSFAGQPRRQCACGSSANGILLRYVRRPQLPLKLNHSRAVVSYLAGNVLVESAKTPEPKDQGGNHQTRLEEYVALDRCERTPGSTAAGLSFLYRPARIMAGRRIQRWQQDWSDLRSDGHSEAGFGDKIPRRSNTDRAQMKLAPTKPPLDNYFTTTSVTRSSGYCRFHCAEMLSKVRRKG
jgi:hypothetical protein